MIDRVKSKNVSKNMKHKVDKAFREKLAKNNKFAHTQSQDDLSEYTKKSVSMISDTCQFDTTADLTLTPKERRNSTHLRHNKSRSKSRNKEGEIRKFPSERELYKHKNRRIKSSERDEKQENVEKYQAKCSDLSVRNRDDKRDLVKPIRRFSTPEPVITKRSNMHKVAHIEPTPMDLTTEPSLKSKLLGRTKDLLEAALHRIPKSNSSDQLSPAEFGANSSLGTGKVEQAVNAEDSPLGEPELMLGSHVAPIRRLQKKNHGIFESQNARIHNTKSKNTLLMDIVVQQPLPALSTDVLSTETSTENNENVLEMQLNEYKRHKRKSSKLHKTEDELRDFLTEINCESFQTMTSYNGLPPLIS
ncbi:unnamed protein product [Heterobilharzia americana]|nr:unnamed protein product [Heterobilharzia americana]